MLKQPPQPPLLSPPSEVSPGKAPVGAAAAGPSVANFWARGRRRSAAPGVEVAVGSGHVRPALVAAGLAARFGWWPRRRLRWAVRKVDAGAAAPDRGFGMVGAARGAVPVMADAV